MRLFFRSFPTPRSVCDFSAVESSLETVSMQRQNRAKGSNAPESWGPWVNQVYECPSEAKK
jgi:hypothetical protein